MSIAIAQTIQVLQILVQGVPLGTNLALLQLMWTILNGSFLQSRGGIFPALQANGFRQPAIYRIWQAFGQGKWRINTMLQNWNEHVEQEGKWQPVRYEGYSPLVADWTAIWRPKLEGWRGKMYNGLVGKATRGIGFGLVCGVGEVEGQRIPLLRHIMRMNVKEPTEKELKESTLKWLAHHQGNSEILVVDAGVEVSDLQRAGITAYVLRGARNFTARQNKLPEYKGRGTPLKWGDYVRPLARTYQGKKIAATPAERREKFKVDGRQIRAEGWFNLVRSDQQPSPTNPTFAVWVFYDPLYKEPMVLISPQQHLPPLSLHQLYRHRWPVEQIPLVGKQLLGLHRQFVFAEESCQRLPELAFLLANVLTYLATTLPVMPTGFWDKRPKKVLAACVGCYMRRNFLKMPYWIPKFEKRGRLRLIYRRVWPLIEGRKHRHREFLPFNLSFSPSFSPFAL